MTTTALIQILVIIVVLGIVVYVVETFIPMDALFRTLFRIVLAIGACVILLRFAGLL